MWQSSALRGSDGCGLDMRPDAQRERALLQILRQADKAQRLRTATERNLPVVRTRYRCKRYRDGISVSYVPCKVSSHCIHPTHCICGSTAITNPMHICSYVKSSNPDILMELAEFLKNNCRYPLGTDTNTGEQKP